MVSYVGKWKYKSLEQYIKEFWSHAPIGNALIVEIAAVNDKIFLSIHQGFEEDTVMDAFKKDLYIIL